MQRARARSSLLASRLVPHSRSRASSVGSQFFVRRLLPRPLVVPTMLLIDFVHLEHWLLWLFVHSLGFQSSFLLNVGSQSVFTRVLCVPAWFRRGSLWVSSFGSVCYLEFSFLRWGLNCWFFPGFVGSPALYLFEVSAFLHCFLVVPGLFPPLRTCVCVVFRSFDRRGSGRRFA